MKITVKEAGEFFRGLLLLVKADHQITHQEGGLMERVGKALGLERDFCRQATREVLQNPWIEGSPPYFSQRAVAEAFLRDGLTIAARDGSIHAAELAWLHAVAVANGVEADWLLQEKALALTSTAGIDTLEVEKLVSTDPGR